MEKLRKKAKPLAGGSACAAGRETVDLYRQHKAEYAASKKPGVVVVGPACYLAVQGTGEPGSEEFQAAIQALYSLAWTLKMTRRFGGQDDFKASALEGVYRSRCEWTLLIRVPPFVTKAELRKAAEGLVQKGKPEAVRRVELIRMREGRCSQVLQMGPYDTVARTLEDLQGFEAQHGLACAGPLHEIYMNDPRRVAPEKIKTVIRRPVRKSG